VHKKARRAAVFRGYRQPELKEKKTVGCVYREIVEKIENVSKDILVCWSVLRKLNKNRLFLQG